MSVWASRCRRWALIPLLLLAAAVPVSVAAASPSASNSHPAKPMPARLPRDRILSNERTYTTWTIANSYTAIRAQPNVHSGAVATLQAQTPDGFLQSYVLLREHWTRHGVWVKLRIPGRPNGRTGWVPRAALADFQAVHTQLVVNRTTRQLTLYRRGRAIFRAPVGVGKPSSPTPAGHFWISEAFASSNSFYGPYAFATTDYSTLTEWPGGGIVGLHGTNEPSLVPGDPSHGCIRLHNNDILTLSHLVPIGTPLLVI
jgi:lipoprotein-anchoring transpeptidase ErfK/SrfK